MKASEALQKLPRLQIDSTLMNTRSRVDETKTLNQMLMSWSQLFEAYPEMKLGSIMKYNVNRDFQCL